MPADLDAVLEQDRDVFPVQLIQPGVGVHIYFNERDPKGPQGRSHLFAQMAVHAPKKLNLCRQARRS